jgi:hypothetical protein
MYRHRPLTFRRAGESRLNSLAIAAQFAYLLKNRDGNLRSGQRQAGLGSSRNGEGCSFGLNRRTGVGQHVGQSSRSESRTAHPHQGVEGKKEYLYFRTSLYHFADRKRSGNRRAILMECSISLGDPALCRVLVHNVVCRPGTCVPETIEFETTQFQTAAD